MNVDQVENYYCYLKVVDIALEFENVDIETKPKRGRKAQARKEHREKNANI